MPLVDLSYQNAALDAIVATWPTSGAVYPLFDGDPTLDGVELPSDGGYVAATFDPAAWAAADSGEKTTTDPVVFAVPTDSWGAVATYWGVRDSAGVLVYSAELADEIEVSTAGTTVSITPSIFFDEVI